MFPPPGFSPGNASQVCQHIVKLLFLQLTKRRVLWENNDGAAILSSATWKYRFGRRQLLAILFKMQHEN